MPEEAGAEVAPPKENAGYPTNIQPFPKQVDDWVGDDIKPSLNNLYAATTSAVQGRIDWYDRKAAGYGAYSQRLRRYSIYLIGVGALAPLVSGPLSDLVTFIAAQIVDSQPTIELEGANIGYIALAIAGTLVAVDNFFGYSDSWMRFRLTQADLVRRLVRFRYDWAEMIAALEATPTSKQARPMIRLHRDFVDSFEEVVEAETQTWASRLQTRLLSFDRTHKFQNYSESPGQIEITIEGWDKLDADSRRLFIGDLRVEPDASGRKLTAPMSPGSYRVKVTGQLTDKTKKTPVEVEQSVEVKAGATVSKTLPLSARI